MTHRTTRVSLGLLAALSLTGGLIAYTQASANEPLDEGPATLQDFVKASVPQWNFARANRNDPCWPEAAFDADGNPADGAGVQNWPNSDGDCAEHGSDFPTYYTVKKCNDSDIRVSFTIYMATSGFKPSGHRHDFEHVDVVWKRDGDRWNRHQLLQSSHGGHHVQDWEGAESWNADRGSAGKGREFPRIFVGWGSHAMFNNQGGLKDVLSQYTDNEYRHADYPSWADQGGGLVEVPEGSDLARKFKESEDHFGSADGNPVAVAEKVCEHK